MRIETLFWRALGAFLALPGIVAFVVPWLLRPESAAFHAWGLVPLGIGTVLLLWCVRDFYVAGRGSLAPWAPPERLVTAGLYRVTRNPMYVAVVLILVGWALTFPSRVLWFYAGAVAIAFHLRVIWGEEPWLARRHGEQWTSYAARVPRWGLPLRRSFLGRRRRPAS
ncbi:MAG TPA: isoprenylcysteine carboxylmethyltransferase family protein [Gemmatimonadaceae bacterium]|nr:isoprenylcysteine carboxylmethyltransferase family protein [Gemmatimonadaceae bacterium]